MERVEFTLLFENYLDWAGPFQTSRRPRFVGKALALGLFLIGMGFLFARWSKDTAPPAGVLALMVGLFLTIVSLPLWFILERPSAEKTKAQQKKFFDRYYRQPRVLEFDATHWSFSYGDAANVRKWNDLTSFRDSGRTIVLVDTFVHYPLNGAAFGKEQRDELKQICENALSPEPKLFSIPMYCSAASYIRSMVAYRWRKRTMRMLSLYVLGALLACLMGVIFADALSIAPTPIILGLILLMPLFELARDRRQFNSYYALYVFHSAEVSEDSICFRKPLELRKVRLSWLIDYFETPWEFQLYVAEDHFYLVPKADLSQEQRSQFRKLLRPNIPP